MAAQTQTLIAQIRTIVWIDGLMHTLGLGRNALDRLYFEKYVSGAAGAQRQMGESDRRFLRYYKGAVVPRPDPILAKISPGRSAVVGIDPLRAMELEAPGSARSFFLPLFNLLDGRVQSSDATLAWIARSDIEGALFNDVFKMLTASLSRKWSTEGTNCIDPACLTKLYDCGHPFSVRMVREEMLRLNDEIVSGLFQERNGYLYRWFRPTVDELDIVGQRVSLDNLTAAIGLYIEAVLIGSTDRIQPFAELIKRLLPALCMETNFKRVSDKLTRVIQVAFGPAELLGYSRKEAEVNGFPGSWAHFVAATNARQPA